MINKSNLIIVCQPALSSSAKNKFYIIESIIDHDPEPLNEVTLIGDIAISGHIVAIENTFNAIKKAYKKLLKENLLRPVVA